MPTSVPKEIPDITGPVLRAMPGWRFVKLPEGFGWAPNRHLRAELVRGGETVKVVIRQTWSSARLHVEKYLYCSVLGQFRFRTPRLLATFEAESGGEPWMILEDVGERYADQSRSRDRRAFLQTLGRLHGQGLRLVESGHLADTPVPHFSKSHLAYDEWKGLLRGALGSTHYGLESWVVPLWSRLWRMLVEQPETLLHGDTDYSNAVISDGGVALVDWERACIGPASVDLGRALAPIRSAEEIEPYRVAYCDAAGAELTAEAVRLIADTGLAHNSFRWICHYIRRIIQARDPGAEWRRSAYDPCLEQLCRIHHRHPDWSNEKR